MRRLARQAPVGCDRFLLNLGGFAVLQRHVEEDSLHRIKRGVGAGLHARQGKRQGLLIAGIGAPAPAVDIARKLIKQKDEA